MDPATIVTVVATALELAAVLVKSVNALQDASPDFRAFIQVVELVRNDLEHAKDLFEVVIDPLYANTGTGDWAYNAVRATAHALLRLTRLVDKTTKPGVVSEGPEESLLAMLQGNEKQPPSPQLSSRIRFLLADCKEMRRAEHALEVSHRSLVAVMGLMHIIGAPKILESLEEKARRINTVLNRQSPGLE